MAIEYISKEEAKQYNTIYDNELSEISKLDKDTLVSLGEIYGAILSEPKGKINMYLFQWKNGSSFEKAMVEEGKKRYGNDYKLDYSILNKKRELQGNKVKKGLIIITITFAIVGMLFVNANRPTDWQKLNKDQQEQIKENMEFYDGVQDAIEKYENNNK